MDPRLSLSSPNSAVSGLMLQLKNGEISKMQLFQQIAKLQAASAQQSAPVMPLPTNPPPGPVFEATTLKASPSTAPGSGSSLPFSGTTSVASRNYSSPPASTMSYEVSQGQVGSTVPATAAVGRMGAQTLPISDAEVLSAGVSHEKAQRLSVQEWMATKTRAASGPAMTTPAVVQSTPSVAPSLFAGGQAQRTDQFSSAPVVSATGPSLFSFLNPPRNDQSSIVGALTPAQTIPAESQPSNEWNSLQPLEANHENCMMNTGSGLLSANEYLHFDPFGDDPHSRDDVPGTNGKSKGGRSGDQDKFHTRVTRWKSQKEAVREQMKQQLLQSELDECTFTPKVNPKSTKVVQKLRGRQRGGGGVGEIDGVSGSGSGGGAIAVSERLYQEADNYKAREELAARMKAEEEAEIERECTFRPKINKNNAMTDKVKPKYMEIPKRDTPVITPAAIEAAAKELEQCTFVPQVNPISQDMVSAQLYLQQNIYERLSRPCVPATDSGRGDDYHNNGGYTEDLDDMDPSRLHTQDDMYVRSRRRRGSSGPGQLRSAQRPRSAGGIVTDAEKAERAKQFEEFIERQKFHEQAKKKRLHTTQQQLVPPHRPSINKKSQMMMDNGRKGDFLERISQYAIRKEQDTVKNKAVRVSDPHCTFKPTINPTSAKRNARSVTELSRGDLLRRETTQRLMKLKMEQEEMASLTFRPELSRASQRVEGRLKILSSPDTYLQRIQQQSQAHMTKQRRALQEKEMEEFSECTFKPRTIDAPAYVQRIARSVVLTKALRKQQDAAAKANQKPEWK